MNTFEMNNARKDSDAYGGAITKHSPVVEVFSAMVNGESLERFGKKADVAVNYIKNLGTRADNGDVSAMVELNTIRRFVVETPVMEEMKLLGIFGSYQSVGFDDTIEREVYTHVGEPSREQATGGDVVFPVLSKEVYNVPTFTVSGGYAVDYRRVAAGDMSKENEGLAQVKIDILNHAKLAIVKKIYKAIKEATGVKYMYEFAGLTKTGVDNVLTNVRRNGRPTVVGDYAILSQFTPWAGYVGSVNSTTITGISEKAMNDIAQNGTLAMYNGAVLAEMENPYNIYKLNAAGDNFETLLPAGLAFIVPTGVKSPIATYTRGGLTSFTGNDIKTGKVLTRFDIEVGCDVAKGHEYKIGVIYDTNVGGID
jgi:hypothetical protein